jgi:alpha-tubulin suppressor-like RCC1 family protein
MRAFRPGWVLAMTAACGGGGVTAPSPSSPPGDTGAEAKADVPDVPDGPVGAPASLDCGDFTTCATSESGAVLCWGRAKEGELGAGAAADQPKPSFVRGLGKKAKQVALASQFACALLEDGSVSCWGTGRVANDGKAQENARPTPVVGVKGALELAASGVVACARTGQGAVCWGADAATLGSPPAGPFTKVSAGFTHTCALDAKGAVTCWGSGDWGAGASLAKPAITGARDLVAGDRHACVVTGDRKVQCWGMDDAGQLGRTPDVLSHPKPLPVAGVQNVQKLVTGEASTCAIHEDGSVTCWGANGEGELGLGTRSSDERPSKVTALAGVADICLGTAHGCALTKDKKILCWGQNAFGQLGDGTKERRLEPTPVAW